MQKPRITKPILKKKNKLEGWIVLDFKAYYKAVVTKTSVIGKSTDITINWSEESRDRQSGLS